MMRDPTMRHYSIPLAKQVSSVAHQLGGRRVLCELFANFGQGMTSRGSALDRELDVRARRRPPLSPSPAVLPAWIPQARLPADRQPPSTLVGLLCHY